MPKIVLNTTIQYKRKTYKIGETVEIATKDVKDLIPYGNIIEEEQPKEVVIEKTKKSTRRMRKRVGE